MSIVSFFLALHLPQPYSAHLQRHLNGYCAKGALTITIATCAELGVPLAQEKIEGPSMSLTFLGIRLCSTPLLLSLPQDKVDSLRAMLQRILDSRSVHDAFALKLLVGHLVHATKVCPLGKAFLSGLFQVLRGMQHSCGYESRHSLVAFPSFYLARGLCAAVPRVGPAKQAPVLRCIRFMGMWCLVTSALVPALLASRPWPIINRSDGAGTNCTCRCGMGYNLERSVCPLPF